MVVKSSCPFWSHMRPLLNNVSELLRANSAFTGLYEVRERSETACTGSRVSEDPDLIRWPYMRHDRFSTVMGKKGYTETHDEPDNDNLGVSSDN